MRNVVSGNGTEVIYYKECPFEHVQQEQMRLGGAGQGAKIGLGATGEIEPGGEGAMGKRSLCVARVEGEGGTTRSTMDR